MQVTAVETIHLRVPVPDGPGLGIELDEDIEREFTVRYE